MKRCPCASEIIRFKPASKRAAVRKTKSARFSTSGSPLARKKSLRFEIPRPPSCELTIPITRRVRASTTRRENRYSPTLHRNDRGSKTQKYQTTRTDLGGDQGRNLSSHRRSDLRHGAQGASQ